MAAEEYKIGLQVETSSAERTLKSLQNQFARMQHTVKTSTNLSAKELDNLTKMMGRTEAQMNRLNKATQSNSAATAKGAKDYTNLSRVIQDLPYGFNGIANNLQMLVPAAGAAGLAFSGLMSALIFAEQGFGAWIRTSKEAKGASKEFSDELSQVKSSALATGIELQGFVNIARDSKLPLEQRNEALKRANEILGEHGEKLTIANINTNKATESVNLYTQAIINQAIAQKYADKIAELKIQQVQTAEKLAKAGEKVLDIEKRQSAERAKSAKADMNRAKAGQMGPGAGANVAGFAELAKARAETTKAETDYTNSVKESERMQKEMAKAQLLSIQSFTALGYKKQEDTKTTQANTKALKENFDLYKTANAIADAAAGGYAGMFTTTLTNGQATVNTDEMRAMAVEQQQIMLASGRVFQARSAMIAAASDMVKQKMQEQQVAAQQLKMQLLGVAIDGFGSIINAATSAEASFDSIAKAALNLILELAAVALKQIAINKATAISAAVSGASQSAAATGPAAIATLPGFIAAAIGLVTSKIGKFATGGIVTGPTMAMIGEGTEMEAVLPLSQLDALLSNSGGNMPYVLSTSIRGSDLQLVMRRADQQGRFTGNTF